MPNSLDSFVRGELFRLRRFRTFWRNQHKLLPDEFPMSFGVNPKLWTVMFSEFSTGRFNQTRSPMRHLHIGVPLLPATLMATIEGWLPEPDSREPWQPLVELVWNAWDNERGSIYAASCKYNMSSVLCFDPQGNPYNEAILVAMSRNEKFYSMCFHAYFKDGRTQYKIHSSFGGFSVSGKHIEAQTEPQDI